MEVNMQRWFFYFILYFSFPLFAQPLEESLTCRECHQNAYAEWQSSRHAKSDHLFVYRQLLPQSNKENCYPCHQPVYALNLDEYVESRVNETSVNCDFCHAVRIEPKEQTYQLVAENVKFGPIKDAIAYAHQCDYKELYTTAEFCMTCHDYNHLPLKQHFSSVYDEWKESRFYEQGVVCQDCHMPARLGKAATLGKIRDTIHSHHFYNGESREFLHQCAELQLTAVRAGENINIELLVTNRSVGHKLPSGSPLRMVILQVEIQNEQLQPLWRNWYKNPIAEDENAVFGKRFYSADNSLVLPWDESDRVIDKRLIPDSTVTLNYFIQDSTATWIEAKLLYHILPPPYENRIITGRSTDYSPRRINVVKEKIKVIAE
jgi:nitrate/TMAO reductase-like tetraheme cytochrome c subunit